MQLTTRDAQVVFRKLDVEEVQSTHHVRGFVKINGVRVLPLHYSRGRKPFPGHTSEKFRKSLLATVEEIQALVSCSLDGPEYLSRLAARLDP